jgi:hypothetical protein
MQLQQRSGVPEPDHEEEQQVRGVQSSRPPQTGGDDRDHLRGQQCVDACVERDDLPSSGCLEPGGVADRLRQGPLSRMRNVSRRNRHPADHGPVAGEVAGLGVGLRQVFGVPDFRTRGAFHEARHPPPRLPACGVPRPQRRLRLPDPIDRPRDRDDRVAGRQHLSLVDVDISQAGHPFWTGRTRAADTEGRIARFRRRYGQGALPGAEPSPASD